MSASIVDCGIDWLTLVTPASDALDTDALERMHHAVTRDVYQGQSGIETKPWSFKGYAGWARGGFRWGYRRDGTIAQASSATADVIARAHHWYGWHATRVDLQATVHEYASPGERIEAARHQALATRSAASGGRPSKVRHISGHGDGDSLYIGSRASQVMVRIYDKGAESPAEVAYRGCVRYEIEVKGLAAQALWGRLIDERDTRAALLKTIAARLAHHGITSPLDKHTDLRYNPVGLTATSDLDTQLAWLERSVAPVVKKLARLGYLADVARALSWATAEQWDTSDDVSLDAE